MIVEQFFVGGPAPSPPPVGTGGIDLLWAFIGRRAAAPPTAAFVAAPLSGSVPLIVSFTDQSSGSPTSWLWDFGDGAMSASQNPVHVYASAGLYTVSLTVSNASGSDQLVKPGYIDAALVGGGGGNAPVDRKRYLDDVLGFMMAEGLIA